MEKDKESVMVCSVIDPKKYDKIIMSLVNEIIRNETKEILSTDRKCFENNNSHLTDFSIITNLQIYAYKTTLAVSSRFQKLMLRRMEFVTQECMKSVMENEE